MKFFNRICSITLVLALSQAAFAAQTLTLAFSGALPAPTGGAFVIDIQRSGDPVNIAAYSYRLYYDNTRMSIPGLLGVDNTGQPQAAFLLDIGPEFSDSSLAGFNAFKRIGGTTANLEGLVNPDHLGAINANSLGSGPLHVMLLPDPGWGDGLYDEIGNLITPVSFIDALPVTVSAFEIE